MSSDGDDERDFSDDSAEDDEEKEEGLDEGDDNESNEASDNHDGLGDMMQKILNQNIQSANPILAKRKTTQMKELEEEKVLKEENKLKKLERLKKKQRFLVPPDASTADFERQLKKVATRGGINSGCI
jgi:hypothetical protein